MGKSRKLRKDEGDSDDDFSTTKSKKEIGVEGLSQKKTGKEKKKGKKKGDDDWDDDSKDFPALNIERKGSNSENGDERIKVVHEKLKKKDKKKRVNKFASDDDDDDIDIIAAALKSTKHADDEDDDYMPTLKTKKNRKAFVFMDDDEDDDVESTIPARKYKSKSGFGGFMDLEEPDDTPKEEPVTKTKAKKRRDSFEFADTAHGEDDYFNAKPSSKAKKAEKVSKKTKKDKKKVRDFDDDEDEIDRALAELGLEIPIKKPEVKEKVEKQKSVERDVDVDDNDVTAKIPAAKKKEKKDRKNKAMEVTTIEDELKKDDISTSVAQEILPEEGNEGETAKLDSQDESESEDASSKKLKKGKLKDDKDKKKGPGKKQLLAMQEALKKLREEEERLIQEEEEKLRAAEEAERQRLENLRLEQERKEKRKQKEKEKKERLKAEGKLLNKSQKLQRARMAATLQLLKAQGLDVPNIGEKKERAVKPLSKMKPAKPKIVTTPDEKTAPVIKTEISVTENSQPEEKEKVDAEDDVKDAWDESSDSEEEEKLVKKRTKVGSSDEDYDSKSENSDSESESESDDDSSSSSDSDDHKPTQEKLREKVLHRIQKRREEAEHNRSVDKLRSPIVCVLGHVDTGKTKILDKIRHTNVQDGEAGGITQQIGATMIPADAIKEQAKMVKNFQDIELKIPGLLIIDTPGHESFSNLRSRGSNLCDIAVLVVDIMHGLEPQTIESINLLKQKKTPFIVALNKIDRLYDWKITKNKDIRDTVKSQNKNTQLEFEEKTKQVILEFSEQGLNAVLSYENKDARTYVSMVPTSAFTGEGMGNLMALVVELTQLMLAKRISYSEELQATVLEVKAIPGLGTTVDVILVNGKLQEGDTIVLAGIEGPVVTQIRSLLMPQPMKELRVKNPYQEFKVIEAAQGIKLTGKDLEKTIAGLNMLVAHQPDEIDICKEEVERELKAVMNSIKLAERGVYVQASTLGSLEALLEFLRTSKIPYSGIRIGPVVKRDVMKASIMLEHDGQFAVILAFDVKIERDAQELADSLGVKIFSADIIYHLFDKFMAHREELKKKKREEFKSIAVFPCKLRILPQFIFNSRDPIVLGVSVEAGVVKEGTPLCVPSQEFLDIGVVTTIEINHKQIDVARKGQEVCIKIESMSGDSPKMFGRHFNETDALVSKISRQSIDACKEYFRDDLQKTDWQLMVELKKLFQIL